MNTPEQNLNLLLDKLRRVDERVPWEARLPGSPDLVDQMDHLVTEYIRVRAQLAVFTGYQTLMRQPRMTKRLVSIRLIPDVMDGNLASGTTVLLWNDGSVDRRESMFVSEDVLHQYIRVDVDKDRSVIVMVQL
jgi:hypothetical protein